MNVYRQSDNTSQIINTSIITADQITTSSLIFPGGQKGEVLVIENENGAVGAIEMGSTNDIFMSNVNNDGLPGYSNNININEVKTNGLIINGTVQGDLFTVVPDISSTPYFTRVPIGTLNQVLVADTVPTYKNIMDVIPDPFSRNTIYTNNLRLNNSLNSRLFTDGSGNVISERIVYRYDNAAFIYTSGVTTIGNFSFNFIGGRHYKLTVSFNIFTEAGKSNNVYLNFPLFGDIRSVSCGELNNSYVFIYMWQPGLTGTSGNVTLRGDTNGGCSISGLHWMLEPMGIF